LPLWSLGAGGGEKREARLAIALSPAHAYPRMLSLKKLKGDRRKQMKTLSKMVFASVLTFVVGHGQRPGAIRASDDALWGANRIGSGQETDGGR
jgi:hypothetical protein